MSVKGDLSVFNKNPKSVKSVRKKIYKYFDETAEEIQDEIALRSRFENPDLHGVPQTGTFYIMKYGDDEGIFFLEQIVKGRTTMYLFRNVVTNVKTTFTFTSIKDVTDMRMVSEKEVEKYKANYRKSTVFSMLGAKKAKK